MRFIQYAPRFALVALVSLSVALPAQPQTRARAKAPPPAVPVVVPQETRPWLYVGSDIPPDTAWKFGTLANGLRYAVRRNGVPPGQVSVRVRIDAGSLMEQPAERGFAHLIEHLSFRGSALVPDGESKRVWQRLGVTFGSDSNASTSFVSTTYKLDLPSATDTGLDQSMQILAGMMDKPNITAAALNAERPVVLAEQREGLGPQARFGEAQSNAFFAGQPLADRRPIGTVETLQAATPESVKAFHDRWYRPDRAVIAISGDFDPAVLEAMIVKNFGGWKASGPAPTTPDFGKPVPDAPVTIATTETSLPSVVSLAWLRPWSIVADTVQFNQDRYVRLIAVLMLNRRLETRARTGGSYIQANASIQDVARSANMTYLSIIPVGDNWEAALKDVRSEIATVMTTPPTQAEIDRELAEIDAALKNGVDTSRVEASARQADTMVEAIDIAETVASAETSLAIFRGAVDKKMFTPDTILAASKAAFAGVAVRGVVNARTGDTAAATKLATALSTEAVAAIRTTGGAKVTFDQLPPLGTPGTVISRTEVLTNPSIEKMVFANGVNLLVYPNTSETSKVYVRVRFGRGLAGLPANRMTPAWAGDLALMASGVGPLGQEELDRLTGDRQMGLNFGIDDDAFILSGQTTGVDLTDQLRLLATKLAAPGWDPNPVARARALYLTSYDSMASTPDGVLSRDLDALLHAGDPRWGTPTRKAIEALDATAFRTFWEPLLRQGPIEVQVFGDVTADAAIAAVARSFGALAPRAAAKGKIVPPRFPAHVAKPVVRYHSGQPDQAAAVIAWGTSGGTDAIAEGRKLEVLAAVFRDRLLEKLRSEAGLSYTPNVVSQWSVGMPAGGRMLALGMVPPDKVDFFFTLARGIAADLVAKPIEPDELRRALAPLMQSVMRMSSGNSFWMDQTAGGAFDPKRIESINTLPEDYGRTSPAELQALAAKYLTPEKDWSMTVLPQPAAKK